MTEREFYIGLIGIGSASFFWLALYHNIGAFAAIVSVVICVRGLLFDNSTPPKEDLPAKETV